MEREEDSVGEQAREPLLAGIDVEDPQNGYNTRALGAELLGSEIVERDDSLMA